MTVAVCDGFEAEQELQRARESERNREKETTNVWGHISTLFLCKAPITNAERFRLARQWWRWQQCVAVLTGKQCQHERASHASVSWRTY